MLPLAFARMGLFKDKASWKYGFSLTSHEVTLKFGTDSKESARKWYNALKRQSEVALQHFSAEFSSTKEIGRGSYSKVHLATNNETGLTYAVKSVYKAKLFESPRCLVGRPSPA